MPGSHKRKEPELLPDIQMHMIQQQCVTLDEVLQETADDPLEFSSFVCYAATKLGAPTVLRALQGRRCRLLLPLLQAANSNDARTATLAAYAVHKMAEDEPAVLLGMLCSSEHEQQQQQQQQPCPLVHLLAALSNLATEPASACAEPPGPLARQQLLSLTDLDGLPASAIYAARALESIGQAAPSLLLHALLQHRVCWDKLLDGLVSSSADTARAAAFTLRIVAQAASDEQLHQLADRVLGCMNAGDDALVDLGMEALHMLAIAAPTGLLMGLLRDQQYGVRQLLVLAISTGASGNPKSRPAAVGALVLMAREAVPQQLQALLSAILQVVDDDDDGSLKVQHGAAAALKSLAVILPGQVLEALLESPQGLHQLLQTVCSSSAAAASGAASALRFITRAAKPFQLGLLLSEVLHLLVTGSNSSMAQGVTALNMMAIAAPAALLQALLAAPRGVQHVLEAISSCDPHNTAVALAALELMARAAPVPMLRALLAEMLQSSAHPDSLRANSAAAVFSYLALVVPLHAAESSAQLQINIQKMEPQTPRQQSGGGACSRCCYGSTSTSTAASPDCVQPGPMLAPEDDVAAPPPGNGCCWSCPVLLSPVADTGDWLSTAAQ